MPTSAHDGVILYDPNVLDTDQPIDTVLVRDAVIGSALHRADVAGQVRAAWCAVDPALTNDATHLGVYDPFGAALEIATASRPAWHVFAARALGAPKVRTGGDGYRLRIRIAGASSAGDRVDFAVIMGPTRAFGFNDDGRGGTAIAVASNITATSPAWLTFDSGDDFIDVTTETISRAVATWLTQTDVGGDEITLRVPPVEVIVVAQTWDAGSEPEFYGWSTAETYGA